MMALGRRSVSRFVALAAGIAFGAGACTTTGSTEGPEDLGPSAPKAFTGGGFETGTAGQAPPSPWVLTDFVNVSGITIQSPQTYAGLNLYAHGGACTTTTQCTGVVPQSGTTCSGGFCQPVSSTIVLNSATGPGTQADATLGTTATLRWPRYGSQCVLVNQLGNHVNVNQLAQTMTVGAGDVDPIDGKVHVRFVLAPVLEDPGHPATQQPYAFVQVTNVTQGGAVLYSDMEYSNQSGVPWGTVNANGTTYRYTDWQLVDVAQSGTNIAMGDQIELRVLAAGCSLGAHMGEVYVDGVNAIPPGIFVSGSGPAQVNAPQNITYALTAENGSAVVACTTAANCTGGEACVGGRCAETGVVVTFATPPSTTFQSVTPPAGATCTTPAVGAVGNVTCTFTSPFAPRTASSFTITVNVPAGVMGQVTASNYSIRSAQETALLGNKIITQIGCTRDADCATGQWCNEMASLCSARLANGTPIPTDAPHTGPTLNGTCTAPAAALVCTSGVCDTADNRCGYAVGGGPCTTANAGTVCRSGACSVNGTCEPAGGCNVDADCASGTWCNESTHACASTLANGAAIPTDAAHTNPTLNGTCTAPVGALVCSSGVCDPADNLCGYANGGGPCTTVNGSTVCRSGACDPDGLCGYAVGDGPCTMSNAAVVCRSGACSVGGTCEPPSGCNVDADCTSGFWCNEGTHMCAATLANGAAIPTDATHTNPTLNGTCTAPVGALVCSSGVCDPVDNLCGYANGSGPCTAADGATTCRSGLCATSGAQAGTCVACVDDTACSGSMPICDTASNTCAACDGDQGTGSPHACPDAAAPFCTTTGACGRCSDNASCRSGTHAGPICNATTGACGTQCAADSDCAAMQWCNDVASGGSAMCTAKLSNGDMLPGATCTPDLGMRACTSGICASAGPNAGRCEQCTMNAQCPSATPMCDPASNACVAAMPDAGVMDAGGTDAGVTDAGGTDARVTDAGGTDARVTDARAGDADAASDAGPVLADSGRGDADAGGDHAMTGSGCSCRTAGGSAGSAGSPGRGLAAMSLAAVFAVRRSRRAGARSRRGC